MKTTSDLNELIPLLLSELKQMAIYPEEEDFGTDYLVYEQDGWLIEVEIQTRCECRHTHQTYWEPESIMITRAWGYVEEIYASYQEGEDDETDFTGDDLEEMRGELQKELDSMMRSLKGCTLD